MKRILLTFCITFFIGTAIAQGVEYITVNGSEVYDFIAKQGYRYPEFKKGRVYFVNKDSGGGMLNYNYLLQTMQFLDPKGDTLVFEDETTIKYITIGKDTFFYDDGFFEEVANTSNTRLAKKSSLKLNGEPMILGAFGKPVMNTQVIGEDLYRGNGAPYKLDINQEFRFTKKTAFYLSTGKNEFTELTKKNIQRLFSDKAGTVNDFIRQHNISLKKEPDVLTLFAFINGGI